MELVALVAVAPSPVIFSQVLDSLGALAGSMEFRLALRRLQHVFVLEPAGALQSERAVAHPRRAGPVPVHSKPEC